MPKRDLNPVYLARDYGLKIGADRLVARFESDVSRDAVGTTLGKHGLLRVA